MLTEQQRIRARELLLTMHYRAKVGHVGGNLSCIDALLLIYHEFLRDGDEFVLSKGHSAGALYVALASCGLIDSSELATFHQNATRLAGHPPANLLPSVRFATGSLGHGLSLAAGLALSNKLVGKNQHVFCLTSDGEWQEGSTMEALAFARHHQLFLTVLIDLNGLQGFGSTAEVASMQDLPSLLSAYGVKTICVDGHDITAMRAALSAPHDGPKFIVLNTIKGKGVKSIENKMESHYWPLTEVQYREAMAELAA